MLMCWTCKITFHSTSPLH